VASLVGLVGFLGLWVEPVRFRGPPAAGIGTSFASDGHQVGASASSLGSRTRLQAATVSANIHPTRSSPRFRVLASPPVVLIQPNPSSMRLRRRWLAA